MAGSDADERPQRNGAALRFRSEPRRRSRDRHVARGRGLRLGLGRRAHHGVAVAVSGFPWFAVARLARRSRVHVVARHPTPGGSVLRPMALRLDRLARAAMARGVAVAHRGHSTTMSEGPASASERPRRRASGADAARAEAASSDAVVWFAAAARLAASAVDAGRVVPTIEPPVPGDMFAPLGEARWQPMPEPAFDAAVAMLQAASRRSQPPPRRDRRRDRRRARRRRGAIAADRRRRGRPNCHVIARRSRRRPAPCSSRSPATTGGSICRAPCAPTTSTAIGRRFHRTRERAAGEQRGRATGAPGGARRRPRSVGRWCSSSSTRPIPDAGARPPTCGRRHRSPSRWPTAPNDSAPLRDELPRVRPRRRRGRAGVETARRPTPTERASSSTSTPRPTSSSRRRTRSGASASASSAPSRSCGPPLRCAARRRRRRRATVAAASTATPSSTGRSPSPTTSARSSRTPSWRGPSRPARRCCTPAGAGCASTPRRCAGHAAASRTTPRSPGRRRARARAMDLLQLSADAAAAGDELGARRRCRRRRRDRPRRGSLVGPAARRASRRPLCRGARAGGFVGELRHYQRRGSRLDALPRPARSRRLPGRRHGPRQDRHHARPPARAARARTSSSARCRSCTTGSRRRGGSRRRCRSPSTMVRNARDVRRRRGDARDVRQRRASSSPPTGSATRDVEHLSRVEWGTVVADEAQFVKNPATKAARAIRQLRAAQRIALTGTPVENRLSELWSILDWTNPGMLGSRDRFRHRYSKPIERADDSELAAEAAAALRGAHAAVRAAPHEGRPHARPRPARQDRAGRMGRAHPRAGGALPAGRRPAARRRRRPRPA